LGLEEDDLEDDVDGMKVVMVIIIVGTLVKSSEKLIEKQNVRTSVCDLKMSHIGEPPQLVSVYIREE